jgi:DNA-cytosine methyltransferase
MNVLSLFDGMSCGQIALNKLGLKVDNYFASEIDKYAIKTAKKNFPNTKHIGDVTQVKAENLPKIDLLIGGSPCQGFSFAGKQLNFDDPRSALFFEFVRLWKECKPKYFLLENVKMKKEYQNVISKYLGVEPIEINSSLLSAQNRKRLYWTNIPGIKQPEDKKINLEHIIDSVEVDRSKSYCLDANYFKGVNIKQYLTKSRRQIVWQIPEATKKGFVEVKEGEFIDLTFIRSKTRRGRLMIEKSNCLTAASHKFCKVTKDWFRLLTPIECERLQTAPDNYTEGVSNSQRYKMLGNGWTVDVICHILKNIA